MGAPVPIKPLAVQSHATLLRTKSVPCAQAVRVAGEIRRPHASCGAAVALPLLSGTLPSTLAEPSPLVDLAIVGTQMSGTLPHGLFAALPELHVLELNCNNFEGAWPRSTDRLQVLSLPCFAYPPTHRIAIAPLAPHTSCRPYLLAAGQGELLLQPARLAQRYAV